MVTQRVNNRLDHLSFKGNLKNTCYGWLRLTPAYLVHLVSKILDAHPGNDFTILDPFCGTGTTALLCAEQGYECDTTDINPFLLWLGRAKSRAHTLQELENFREVSRIVENALQDPNNQPLWLPPLHQIEKWWEANTLQALARAIHSIREIAETIPESVLDLLKVAFCRTMIEQSNVSFGHQSMSFKQMEMMLPFAEVATNAVAENWSRSVSQVIESALSPIIRQPRFLFCDARNLGPILEANYYSCVITSPPYPNRMSYIRELRPYMYWLGYLNTGREAGELDWQAIGGTWGCATSNLTKWEPNPNLQIPFVDFAALIERIAKHSPLLSKYVHKYFYDMVLHIHELFHVVRPHCTINYIVGNSKFYDVIVPVEAIFASIFQSVGFVDINVSVIRKRSSKKELFEFIVSARKG